MRRSAVQPAPAAAGPIVLDRLEDRLLLSAVGPWPRLAAEDWSQLAAVAQRLDLSPAGSLSVSDELAAGGYHLYMVDSDARGRLNLSMQAQDGQVDPYLQVFNVKGRRLRRNDNGSAGSLDSLIDMRVRENQTYYILASDALGQSGPYELSLLSRPTDDYGNTVAAARPRSLRLSGTGGASGRINYGGDVDVLRLVAPRDGSMVVSMHALGRSAVLDCQVSLLGADGQVIQADAGAGVHTAETRFDVTAGQVYYVQASASDGSVGRWRLQIATETPPPPPPPAPEPEPEPPPQPPPPQTPTSGLAVEAYTVGQQLWIVGTDAADTVTVDQANGLIRVTAWGLSQSFDAVGLAGLTIYGFGGDDWIRVASDVGLDAVVYGGLGNDSLFDAGPGAASLYGQEGDDLLVAVGGGVDSLVGGEGLDSLWLDTADSADAASAAEAAVGSIHRVGSFYQSETSNPQSPLYVSTTIAGQGLPDPAYNGSAARYQSFADRPLFVQGPEYNDIVQGSIGDCYYLAALASVAQAEPEVIRQMIAPLGDGTYAVRFYYNGQPTFIRLDADLPVTASGSLYYARLGPDQELWVPLVEKAYCFFRTHQDSYASIHGGWMSPVYREVTNKAVLAGWTSGQTQQQLYDSLSAYLAQGSAISIGSYSAGGGPIVGGHAYMIKSVQMDAGAMTMTVYNPWGVDGRGYDGNNDGLLTITMTQVQQAFSSYSVCLV